MIKLTAGLGRKVPIPGRPYRSQHFDGSMEVEVADGESPEVVRDRLRRLYKLLSDAVDEQIAAGQTPRPVSDATSRPPQTPSFRLNGFDRDRHEFDDRFPEDPGHDPHD